MITRSTSIVAIATLALGAGCDFRTFDDLADEAWATSVASPGELSSDNFGTGVGVLKSDGPGVIFLATGGNDDGVAELTFDAKGALTADGESLQGGATGDNADDLAIPAPIASDTVSATGAVAIGVGLDESTGGLVAVYRESGLFISSMFGSAPVHALGFGAVDNPDNPGVVDLVFTAGNQLMVHGNYGVAAANDRTLDACTIVRDRGYDIAVADVHTGSPESEILLAMGNSNKDGAGSSVMIIAGSTVAAANDDTQDQSCIAGARTALGELAAPGGEADFGNALVVADFDGNGTPDIAVGAPAGNKVYVYLNVDLAGGAPAAPVEINGPADSGNFGLAVAAGDFDGDGSDELVVGDPQAQVDGVNNAGRAYLIPSANNFGTKHVLGDSEPEADQNFGRSLEVGAFGSGGATLAVGARKEVFVYFRTHVSDDVRQ